MDKESENSFKIADKGASISTLHTNRKKGIILSFISLILLSFLPIISNSRPQNLSALSYAFYLSFWELICSLPLLFIELRSEIILITLLPVFRA